MSAVGARPKPEDWVVSGDNAACKKNTVLFYRGVASFMQNLKCVGAVEAEICRRGTRWRYGGVGATIPETRFRYRETTYIFATSNYGLHAQVCTGRPGYLVGSYLPGRPWVSHRYFAAGA